jgi:hypothetical protein
VEAAAHLEACSRIDEAEHVDTLPSEWRAAASACGECLAAIRSWCATRADLVASHLWGKLPAQYDGAVSLANEFRRKGFLRCAAGCAEISRRLLLQDLAKADFPDPHVQHLHSRCCKQLVRVRGKLEAIQAWLVDRERQGVEVESIDGYQGAENDIVIVSLVRSNPDGDIGYLSALNRRCVAQSRARCGMYFVGNPETLSSCRHWKALLATLEHRGCCGTQIPLHCARHPSVSKTLACTGSDINLADGICRVRCAQQMACGLSGHVCQRFCHTDDGHYDCKQCELLRLEKERKERAARQRMVEQSKVDARREMARLRAQPQGRILEEITPAGVTAREYFKVKDRAEKYMQVEHGHILSVARVQKVLHPVLEVEWLEARLKLHDPSQPAEQLFHGTSAEGVEGITQHGFRLPPRTSANMFGQGVYFATDSTKSAQELYTKGSRRLLLCDVLMGRACTVEALDARRYPDHPLGRFMKTTPGSEPEGGRAWLDVGLQQVHREGFDSVYAKRGGILHSSSSGPRGKKTRRGVLFDEMVVYRPEQALPRYIVHYDTIDSLRLTTAIARPRSLVTSIKATRHVDLDDPLQMHYRVAESQFERMIGHSHRGGHVNGGCRITQVDFVFNPRLVSAFRRKQQEYDNKYGKHGHELVIAFHGTKPEHIDSIVHNGFRISKVGSTTDSGWWGAGIYFSENTATSLGYNHRCQKLLLCQVLLGKQKHVTQRCDGGSCKPGFDSHGVNPCDCGCGRYDECVIFDESAMLPTYVVHYD